MDLRKRLDGMSPQRLKLLALELDEKVQHAEAAHTEPIAIIGIGCRMPGADSPAEYWELLDKGRDAIREVPPDRWNVDEYFDSDPDAPGSVSSRSGGFLNGVDLFDARFFGISRREAVSMDPQQRILLEVCWEALENAGQSPQRLHGSQTGVFVGISTGDYHHLLLARGRDAIDTYLATGSAHSVASGRVAYALGFHGPNLAVDTACSSSLVTVHLAAQSLRNRECSMALAGGVNLILSPDISIALSKAHMLAEDGRCKAFDAAADGFVRAEGCGLVVLKRLSDAVANGDNILALIRGSAVNQDGRSSGLTAPNGPAQEAVLRQALANGRVEAAEIDYVEAHGTGTSLGDPIEAHALAAVLGAGRDASHPLVVGSVKTNFGHLEAAAGVAGLIKVVLSLQHQRIPPHLHFHTMNPHIDWKGLPVEIPVHGKDWKPGTKPRLAGVSSFGFSGTNAHVIVQEAPIREPRKSSSAGRGIHLLALSARSETALTSLAQRYAERLLEPEIDVGDACFTANTGRSHFSERAVYVASTREQLQAQLARGSSLRGRAEGTPEVAFLFTGQGAQYAGMGRELYQSEPVFRSAMDACAVAVRDELEPGLIDLLYGNSTHLLDDTRYTQPACFALQYALAMLWGSWGVEPTVVLGHSVGEYAAACVAGLYTVEDGMRLITARGRLTGALPQGQGGMAAILAPRRQVDEAVARFSGRVSVAAYNGPQSLVISGGLADVELLSQEFLAQGVQVERLRVSHAFHSPLMDEVASEFAEQMAGRINFSEPRITLISTVTGGVVGLEQAGTSQHWRRQVREGVRFHQAIQAAAAQGCSIFVEIGPGSTLLGLGQESNGQDQVWTPSIRRSKADHQQMAESLAQLYVRGVPVNWAAYHAPHAHRRIALPTYPFQRQRYWLDSQGNNPAPRSQTKNPLLGRRTDAAIPVYQGILDLEATPWIAGHRVAGVPIVPAAAYIEMALDAAKDSFENQTMAVADLDLKEPLRAQLEAAGVDLQTVLFVEGSGRASFRIFSRTDAASSEWTLHATGRLEVAGDPPISQSLSRLQQRITTNVAADSFYDALAAKNIELSRASRNMRRLWVGEKEALGEISIEATQNNAALLDSCFHTVGAAAHFGLEAQEDATYVLQSIQRFEQLQPIQGTVFAHARILNAEDRSMTGELDVYDQSGIRIATATGIQLRAFSAAPVAPRDWFYRLEWRESPLTELSASKAGELVADSRRLESLNARIARLADAEGLEGYDILRPALDRVCAGYIASAFESAGDVSNIGVIEKHRRLLNRLVDILAHEVSHTKTPAAECDELMRQFPQFGAELALVRRCGPRLLEVLRGQIDPLELLAPGGSFESLDRLYIHSPAAKVFNPAAREALEAAIESVPRDRTLRILEVGAGTGGTTSYLAPALRGRDVEYTFTDVSPLFVARAQETFLEYPFMRYAVLDAERPPEAQGFGAGQFDIVIAANVLHATTDLRRTIRNVRGLLRPSGLMMLIEGASAERWVDLTFGMTEGWWKFEDTDLRPEHALLSRSQWLDLLGSEGCRTALIEPSPRSQQILLLAQVPSADPQHRCVKISKPEDLAAAPDCDVLIFDATAGATTWDLVSTLKAVATRVTPPRVWLVTESAQPVGPDDPVSPSQAAFWGIARTAALEYPQFWGGVIDVEPGIDGAPFAIDELKRISDEDQIAYRNGKRFILRIVRQENIRSAVPAFDAQGVYLISGGLGNLGMETAGWLVRHGARNLLLTGRTASRDQRKEQIVALESLGASIAVITADVASAAGINSIRARLGNRPLLGIIHTAAVFDSTPIAGLTRETLDKVFRPKGDGAGNLIGLASRELQFLVFFSSTTALTGVRDMAAYASPNAYVDSLAHKARCMGLPAVAVNWGTWELMRGTSEQDRQNYLRTGLQPMSSAQALSALGDILASGATQAMAASIDWNTFKAVYQSRRNRPIFESVSSAQAAIEKTPSADQPKDLLAMLMDAHPSDRLRTAVSMVLQEAAAVLGLKPEEVDSDLGLFELGMDSLMSVELKRRLAARCGKPLPATLTFNYPSVNALAAYLISLVAPDLPAVDSPLELHPPLDKDQRDRLSEDELAGLLEQALNIRS